MMEKGKHKTSFTHYKLNIHFQYILLNRLKLLKIDNYKWINKGDLKNAALPSPIKKILNGLKDS